ncbi:MAG TPA: hypothetical protein VL463_18760 [Kofleriaceae bacterium]|nr:hypothetical protein [Kofleriaceae bacterium]
MVAPFFAVSAHADGALPKELTSACGDQVKGAKKAQLIGHHISEVVYQVWLPGGRAIASIVGGGPDDPCGGGPECKVFPVGRATSRLSGKLGANGASAKIFTLPAPTCDDDSCSTMLAMRPPDKEDQILDALRVPDNCTPMLSSVALIKGQDSIVLTCSMPAGAGDNELKMVLHVVDGHLMPLLTFEAGSTQLASPDEKASGACTIGPVGAVQVVKGALRVTRAPDGGQSTGDGKGPACKHQKAIVQDYTWDASQKQLVPAGNGTPTIKDTCDCKR